MQPLKPALRLLMNDYQDIVVHEENKGSEQFAYYALNCILECTLGHTCHISILV